MVADVLRIAASSAINDQQKLLDSLKPTGVTALPEPSSRLAEMLSDIFVLSEVNPNIQEL